MQKWAKIIFSVGTIIFLLIAFFSAKFLKIPLNEEQFVLYEKVAQDVYEKHDQVIVEIPNYLEIVRTETTITVESKLRYTGKVEAKITNGELVFTRYAGRIESILYSLMFGALCEAIFILVCALTGIVYEAIQKKNKRKQE